MLCIYKHTYDLSLKCRFYMPHLCRTYVKPPPKLGYVSLMPRLCLAYAGYTSISISSSSPLPNLPSSFFISPTTIKVIKSHQNHQVDMSQLTALDFDNAAIAAALQISAYGYHYGKYIIYICYIYANKS